MHVRAWIAVGVVFATASCRVASKADSTRSIASVEIDDGVIEVASYRDKLEGSLYGQLFGLAWGFARGIEFRYRRRLVPDDDFPDWNTEVDINRALRAPAGDDFYCEFSGLLAMRAFGPEVAWGQMEGFYRDTQYATWHSDLAMRRNLRNGVRAPRCGHYSKLLERGADDASRSRAPLGHGDDLDAQMQVDFCGTTNPGNVQAAIAQAWKFGHMMNYGDGAIGAAVMAAMNAEAFFARNVAQIADVGVAAAPEGSTYRSLLNDVVAWHRSWPDDWQRTWRALDEKWGATDRCPQGVGDFNIDAKLHGGFVLIGLLYGGGDFRRSLEITIRCGQDTDTSAQNLGSILGAFLGKRRLPERVVMGLSKSVPVQGTDLRFDDVVALQEDLARRSLRINGGRAIGSGADERWEVRREPSIAPILEQWPTSPNDAPQLEVGFEGGVDGRSVTFTASATDDDGVAAYQWHFGDLSFANGSRVRHTYPRSGRFEATCYVTDVTGHTTLRRIAIVMP